MNIHDFVNTLKDKFAQELSTYIENVFDEVIDILSYEHKIEKTVIKSTLNKTMNKSIKKCSNITKLGHSCKYNAKEGHKLCIKHFNMI